MILVVPSAPHTAVFVFGRSSLFSQNDSGVLTVPTQVQGEPSVN